MDKYDLPDLPLDLEEGGRDAGKTDELSLAKSINLLLANAVRGREKVTWTQIPRRRSIKGSKGEAYITTS